MVILTVMYPKTEQSRFHFDYYLEKHIPLVKERLERLGLGSVRLMRGTAALDGTAPPFEVIAELTFSSIQHLREALGRHGEEIIGDIRMFTDVQPAIQINEVL